MTACLAMINLELSTNESRAAKFSRNAAELLNNEAVIVTCPNEECVNGYTPKQHDCWAHGYSDEGCPWCNNLGYTAPMCEICKGQGEVLMYPDGHTEPLI